MYGSYPLCLLQVNRLTTTKVNSTCLAHNLSLVLGEPLTSSFIAGAPQHNYNNSNNNNNIYLKSNIHKMLSKLFYNTHIKLIIK